MRSLISLLLTCCIGAVDIGPVPVLQAVDGNTLEVELDRKAVRVRLLYAATPDFGNEKAEARQETKEGLEQILGLDEDSPLVFLAGPGDSLQRDENGDVLAVVHLPYEGDDGQPIKGVTTVNVEMIAAGWSVYCRQHGEAPALLHVELQQVERDAKRESNPQGFWRTSPQLMRQKAAALPAKSDR